MDPKGIPDLGLDFSLGCFRVPPTSCVEALSNQRDRIADSAHRISVSGGVQPVDGSEIRLYTAVDIWVNIFIVLRRVSFRVRWLTLGFLNQQVGLWRLSHFVSLHFRLALGFLVAIQQFLMSEVSKVSGLEIPEVVEWAEWANFIYNGLSHTIHGTGIFTHMNGLSLW